MRTFSSGLLACKSWHSPCGKIEEFKVDLFACELDSPGIRALANGLHHEGSIVAMRCLGLCRNIFYEEDMLHLTRLVESTRIKSLDIGGNNLFFS